SLALKDARQLAMYVRHDLLNIALHLVQHLVDRLFVNVPTGCRVAETAGCDGIVYVDAACDRLLSLGRQARETRGNRSANLLQVPLSQGAQRSFVAKS